MNTTRPRPTDRAFSPPGHPVRNVSVVLALVVGLLAVAWVGGLVTPRVSIGGGTGSHDLVTGEGTLAPELRNRALAALEIHGAEIVADGVVTGDVTLGATPIDEHPAVEPGERRPLLVRYEVDGCPIVTSPAEWRLAIKARTALGITKTIDIYIGHLGPSAVCP